MADWQNRIIGLEHIPANQLMAHPHNARRHPGKQREALRGSLDTLGWYDAVIYNKRTGYLIDGHARVEEQLTKDEHAMVPVLVVDMSESEEAQALASHDWITQLAEYDKQTLDDLLRATNSDDERVQALLSDLADAQQLNMPDDFGVNSDAKPSNRILPLDVIFTVSGNAAFCCIAAKAGFKYGTNSGKRAICPICETGIEWHKLTFIDNDYFEYNHQHHLNFVKEYRPKYATVRDAMTQDQCAKDGITYYDLPRILDWADEIAEYAENVIVIPKYDCIDEIPDRFMLGYSVPTSHGGTPLHVDRFRGRRVHLLGGSWKAQLAHLAALGDDVVSIDNNYILKQASFGAFTYPDGKNGQITQDLGLPVINPMYVALAISLGNIGYKLQQIYSQP